MGSNSGLQIRAAGSFSSPGVRAVQEDFSMIQMEQRLFAVADGFGGPTAGTAASKTACEAVQNFLVKEARDLDATLPFELRSYYSLASNVLFNSLIHANRKVLQLNQKKNVHEKGGVSILTGYLDGDLLALANVGTCTSWLLRDGEATELSRPRNYAWLLDPFCKQNVSSEFQAPLMALGIAADLEPEIFEVRVHLGDWLVLQTDGMTPLVLDELLRLQGLSLEPEMSTEQAIQWAKGQKFIDNASFLLVIL